MKILIVDDEKDVLDLMKDLFLRKGYDVIFAQSGKAALETIDANKPDVVLLDIRMPEMDGIQTLAAIKQKDPTIDVVMLTAYGYNDKLIDEAMQKGASGYISKNLPLQQIINTFSTLLKTIALKKKE